MIIVPLITVVIIVVAVMLNDEEYCPHCGYYCYGKSVYCTKGKE